MCQGQVVKLPFFWETLSLFEDVVVTCMSRHPNSGSHLKLKLYFFYFIFNKTFVPFFRSQRLNMTVYCQWFWYTMHSVWGKFKGTLNNTQDSETKNDLTQKKKKKSKKDLNKSYNLTHQNLKMVFSDRNPSFICILPSRLV